MMLVRSHAQALHVYSTDLKLHGIRKSAHKLHRNIGMNEVWEGFGSYATRSWKTVFLAIDCSRDNIFF
jgi:hypothetical protein